MNGHGLYNPPPTRPRPRRSCVIRAKHAKGFQLPECSRARTAAETKFKLFAQNSAGQSCRPLLTTADFAFLVRMLLPSNCQPCLESGRRHLQGKSHDTSSHLWTSHRIYIYNGVSPPTSAEQPRSPESASAQQDLVKPVQQDSTFLPRDPGRRPGQR